MIPMQQALDGLSVFAVSDVISAMPNSMAKFVALMAVGSVRNDPAKFIKPYEPMLKAIGIISEDGQMVDEKILRSSLSEAFAEMPKVSWLGFNFTSEDAARLIARIGG